MATNDLFIRLLFGGGWATDFGPSIDAGPGPDETITLPFLVDAENCLFEFDGGPHKIGGTSKVNSTALESGAVVKGLFDYWISGTAGSSAQHRIVHVGAKIKKDDADGSFSDLFTGLETDKVPSYAVLEDLLVMATDSTVDVPKSWDGTTAQNLAGSPPNFAFCAKHQNRMWAAGDAANPSRLYYSALLDPADWVGSGSGSIDIDPSDKDRITGIISHKNELWVFKGPYEGSIHRISGSAPTGGDAFARKSFIEGLGAVGHNTLFRFRDDIGFMWSDGTIHSLAATASFGDFNESALSRPINTYIEQRLNHSRLKHAWASTCDIHGIVLFTVPTDGSTNNNTVLMMDYRYNPVRWAPWPAIAAGCVATIIDPGNNNLPTCMAGGNDGFVRKLLQADRSIDGTTAISYKVTAPVLTFSTPIVMKTAKAGSLGLAPKNDGNITFGWQRDNKAQQTQTVSQGGGDVLAPAAAHQFTLGTSTLGGARFVDRFFDLPEGGEFRSIQLQVANSVNGEDVELHSVSLMAEGGAWSLEND